MGSQAAQPGWDKHSPPPPRALLHGLGAGILMAPTHPTRFRRSRMSASIRTLRVSALSSRLSATAILVRMPAIWRSSYWTPMTSSFEPGDGVAERNEDDKVNQSAFRRAG